jgi:hypothetical protein
MWKSAVRSWERWLGEDRETMQWISYVRGYYDGYIKAEETEKRLARASKVAQVGEGRSNQGV